jgi:hypothetical protein
MRFEIRTLWRALSTLALLFVLVFGASLDVSAHDRNRRGRGNDRGRHLGWERGRRVGHFRRDNDRSRWRRWVRRDRRDDRRSLQRHRRFARRNDDRSWQRSRFGRQRADFRTRRFVRYSSRY